MDKKMSVKCPGCGHTVSGNTEQELINNVKQHDKEHHEGKMTDQEIRQMIRQQQEKAA